VSIAVAAPQESQRIVATVETADLVALAEGGLAEKEFIRRVAYAVRPIR
jgi:hypothetical protein